VIKPYTLHLGDCIEVMRTMPDNSVDSIVTDPPYELGFMGKSWDASGIANSVAMWREALRVLKPGGHLLAFSGSRTYHRMTCAIEDAGFDIRDQIMWVYGSGFPKSLDVSKALEAFAKTGRSDSQVTGDGRSRVPGQHFKEFRKGNGPKAEFTPTTDDAKKWDGWGTALKPAHEPICVARKPLVGTVAVNVLAHGVGALNIDECRVSGESTARTTGKVLSSKGVIGDAGRWPANLIHDGSAEVVALFPREAGASAPVRGTEASAANVGRVTGERERVAGVFHGDKGSAARFFYTVQSEQECNANTAVNNSTLLSQVDGFAQNLAAIAALHVGKPLSNLIRRFMSDMASEFGQNAAPSMQAIQSIEQRFSLELLHISTPAKTGSHANPAEVLALTSTTMIIQSLSNIAGSADDATSPIIAMILGHGARVCDPSLRERFKYCAKASRADRNEGLEDPGPQFQHGSTLRDAENLAAERNGNFHPTVKPTDLMAYLVRLVTPPGGTVLDLFMGSGSTGKAAVREGFRFIGIDMTPEYVAIAEARIAHELDLAAPPAAPRVAPAPEGQMDLFGVGGSNFEPSVTGAA